MAVLKLNNVTTITESSGSLTLANAALGTPTSATLTNATFPAGHVINYWYVLRNTSGSGRSQTITESYVDINLNGVLEITGVTATEGNIMRASYGGWAQKISGDNTYSTLYQIEDGSNMLAQYEFFFDSESSTAYDNPAISLTSLFVVPASFTTKTVTVQARRQTSSAGVAVIEARHLYSDTQPYFELMEIQV